jgi:tetratricopeptide (TPR) repeat protein
MATKKKCFVISPIGDENSEIRKEADGLLWVAKSALEKFDFEVIRVDQIASSKTITNEIIQLIQESELCLIVLTGHNPNVFYEAGRRHETGRPFIQLIRKGDPLPFDVASIRTILYDDIQSLPSAAKVVEQIQKFIEEIEKGGYGASGTGVSMSTIASALDRIERKVGAIMSGTASIAGGVSAGGGAAGAGDLGFVRNPRQAFMAAVAQGNIDQAARILPRLEKLLGPTKELVAAAAFLCHEGYEPAAELVYRLIVEHFEDIQKEGVDGLTAGIGALAQFYIVTDREQEAIPRIEPLINRVVALSEADKEDKAFALNQLSMLYYGVKDYERTLSLEEQIIELVPNDPAYIFNNSLTYEKLGLTQKAIETVDRYMKMDKIQPVHFEHAVEVYLRADRISDARNAFVHLRKADPGRAAVLLMDEDNRRALGL